MLSRALLISAVIGLSGLLGRCASGFADPAAGTVSNPWVDAVLSDTNWSVALSIADGRGRQTQVMKLAQEWVNRHEAHQHVTLYASLKNLVPSKRSSSSSPLTAVFQAAGSLPDGTPYSLMANVRLVDRVQGGGSQQRAANDAARQKAEQQFKEGAVFSIEGTTASTAVGLDASANGGKVGSPPGIGLTVSFDTAKVKPFDPTTDKAAPVDPKAKAKPIPAGVRPDVLILIHPSNAAWLPLMKETVQATQPYVLIATRDEKGGIAPAKVRLDVGAAPGQSKGWGYAIVLTALAADRQTPLGPTSRLDYTVFSRAGDTAKPSMILHGSITGIVTQGKPNEFVKSLINNRIAEDMQIAFGEMVFGDGGGAVLVGTERTRLPRGYPVQVLKNGTDIRVPIALNNRSAVPLTALVEAGATMQDASGRFFRPNTAHFTEDRIVLDPGQKQSRQMAWKDLTKALPPDMATATAVILDERIAAFAK